MTTAVEKSQASHRETRPVFEPSVDVYRTEQGVVLLADLPGVDESRVQVDVEQNILTLSGQAPESETENLRHREVFGGDYRRSFRLSDSIDREGVKASMKKGVLRLEMPFKKETEPTKIKVVAGD